MGKLSAGRSRPMSASGYEPPFSRGFLYVCCWGHSGHFKQSRLLSRVKRTPTGKEPAIPEIGSARFLSEGMGWMSLVTSAILPTNVGDFCIRMLSFNLEGRNERVFGIHENAIRFPLQI